MAKPKKENLPKAVNIDTQAEPGSSITYANEVVATIAGVAANEIEGIAGMVSIPSGGKIGKNKNLTKGIKVEVGPEEVSCEIYLNIEYGRPIQKVAGEVQENVRKAVESMTGLHCVRVDVHVQGVSFEKENSALNAGAKNAKLPTAETEDDNVRIADTREEAAEETAPEQPAETAAEQ